MDGARTHNKARTPHKHFFRAVQPKTKTLEHHIAYIARIGTQTYGQTTGEKPKQRHEQQHFNKFVLIRIGIFGHEKRNKQTNNNKK